MRQGQNEIILRYFTQVFNYNIRGKTGGETRGKTGSETGRNYTEVFYTGI